MVHGSVTGRIDKRHDESLRRGYRSRMSLQDSSACHFAVSGGFDKLTWRAENPRASRIELAHPRASSNRGELADRADGVAVGRVSLAWEPCDAQVSSVPLPPT